MLFVIDTSGSMCVTTAVEGRLTLRGDRTKDMSRLLASGVSVAGWGCGDSWLR